MRFSLIILVLLPIFTTCINTKHFLLVSSSASASNSTKTDTAINDFTNNNKTIDIEDPDDEFICRYPIEPQLDLEEWNNYLQNNLVLDSASLDTIPAGKYNVVIDFIINEMGNISEVSIVKDPGYGLGERVKDVVLQYKTKSPLSTKYMETFRSYRKQPITFIVEEADEIRKEKCKDPSPGKLIL